MGSKFQPPPYGISEAIRCTGYDQTAELQQAANDLFATAGGTADQNTAKNTGFCLKLMDGQEYVSTGIVMPPGMSISSVSGILLPFSDSASFTGSMPVSSGPVLRHIFSGSNAAPLLQNDTSKGIIRSGSAKFALNTVMGLVLRSKPADCPRRGDAPLLQFISAFGVNIIGNLLFTAAGFGLKTITCNAMNILYNNSLYAPWLLHSLVDSNVAFNQVGGGNGYASDSVWLTGDKDASQLARLNLFQSNLFYNNNSNGNLSNQYAQEAGITGIAGDVISLDRNVGGGGDQTTNWIGETPLCFSPGGTLPTATNFTMRRGKTYWATVQANGTSIKLSKDRADKAAGVYITFSAAGSGLKLRVGGNCNLYFNEGSKQNQFLPFRSDQSFGHAVLFDDAYDNIFEATLVAYSRCGGATGQGYVLPTAGPAIDAVNGSLGNVIRSGLIDGAQHGQTGVGPSNQKFGIGAGMVGNDTRGIRVVNHTAASTVDNQAGASGYENPALNPRRIRIPLASYVQFVATATKDAVSLTARNTMTMTANGATASAPAEIPPDWSSFRARIIWANNGTAAGTVTWSMRIGAYAVGASAAATEQLLAAAPNATVSGAADTLLVKESVIDFSAALATAGLTFADFLGKYVSTRLIRSDGSGNPTVQVLEVILEEVV